MLTVGRYSTMPNDVSRSIPFEAFISSSELQATTTPKATEFLKRGRDVERLLLADPGLKDEVERLYRDRQVYVDAANAILVGAALIAGVTFGGWLQPPLGDNNHTTYRIVRIFWTFNSLSFFFAIASVMAGAGAVFPMANMYIGDVVNRVRDWLALTSFLLLVSVFSVLIAFGAAGFASLSQVPGLMVNMTVTSAIGSIVCGSIGLSFLRVIYQNRPNYLQLGHSVKKMLNMYNSFKLADIRDTRKLNSRRQSRRNHFNGILRFLASFLWQKMKWRASSNKTKLHDQATYEEEWRGAFERVYRVLATDLWPYLRTWRALRQNFKSKLQAGVQDAFDRTYSNLQLASESRRSKHQQILQCVNDESPYGLRRATQWRLLSPTSRRSRDVQRCNLKEVLEETVIQIVTAPGGRGLLHLFMNLPTNSCRDICLANNTMDFELIATGLTLRPKPHPTSLRNEKELERNLFEERSIGPPLARRSVRTI